MINKENIGLCTPPVHRRICQEEIDIGKNQRKKLVFNNRNFRTIYKEARKDFNEKNKKKLFRKTISHQDIKT